jgi:large subunit ribosomal protein L4e
MAARPTVSVFDFGKGDSAVASGSTSLPDVFLAPIRNDVVKQVHRDLAKNARQPYAVSRMAGHQTSAESWGTGRAVARIPRVAGGGTHRSGQGAFGNMCRGGRVWAPTKTFRKWHRRVNRNQRRYAMTAAVAASGVPSLVLARGHRVDEVPEVPLVVSDAFEKVKKTKDAFNMLNQVGLGDDLMKGKYTKTLRAGKGKWRNRRYVTRKGPLVVFANNNGVQDACRNIPGVDTANVERLNLLQMAPGGHLGRMVVYTQSAFAKLDEVFGTKSAASKQKKGFSLPSNIVSNADIERIKNSDEVKSKMKVKTYKDIRYHPKQKNPLKSMGALRSLNPYAAAQRTAIRKNGGKQKK